MAWPLYVVFVATFTTSIVGLAVHGLWGDPATSTAVLYVLLGASIVVAFVLCSPGLVEMFRNGRLGSKLEAVNRRLGDGGDVRTRLDEIDRQSSIVGEIRKNLGALAARLDSGGDIDAKFDALATQPKNVAALQTQLDSISTELNKVTDAVAKLAMTPPLDALADNSSRLAEAETEHNNRPQ